jgi:hypothetical protein
MEADMTARLWRRIALVASSLAALGLLLYTVGAPYEHGG